MKISNTVIPYVYENPDNKEAQDKTNKIIQTQNKAQWLDWLFADTCAQAANPCALFWVWEWTQVFWKRSGSVVECLTLLERPRVWASPASLRCGPWAKYIYPSLVLVQPRKARPCLTERLLMGRKESNQTNKNELKFYNLEARCTAKYWDQNEHPTSLFRVFTAYSWRFG